MSVEFSISDLPNSGPVARLLGFKYFFTGAPCERGHLVLRDARTGSCVACIRNWKRRYERKHARTEYYNERKRQERQRRPEWYRYMQRQWMRENKDKVRATKLRYRQGNPHDGLIQKHRRRRAEGRYTKADILAILERQAGICAACQRHGLGLTLDHIVPVAKGGSNWPSNLQFLCGSCNSSKGTMENELFIKRIRQRIADGYIYRDRS